MSAQMSPPISPTSSTPQFYRRTLPESCTSFSSNEGKTLFKEALQTGHMECYFGLAAQFRTQDEPAFCGLSTLVMVLNTLEVDPQRVWKGPWRWYHENMLDCCVPLNIAAKNGVTMDELACLASCNTLSVNLVRANASMTEDDFRTVVKDLTKRDDEVLVVSYSRAVLGQTGTGHFSPIAGYHPEKDLVLILDTARFKYPPHWTSLSLLHKSMQVCDNDTGEPRGFMKLRKSDNVPLVLFKVGASLSLSNLGNSSEEHCGVPVTGNSSLDAFLNTWTTWMEAPTLENSNLAILEAASSTMIKSLQNLQAEDCILTTQVDVSCPERLSATHGCIIKELLESLEALPLFGLVQKQLDELNEPVPCLSTEVTEFELRATRCKRTNSCPKKAAIEGEALSAGFTAANCIPTLTPAHVVAFLICAWPAFKCNVTNCNLLRKAVQAQLYKSSPFLQDEVAQLSKQLNSVLNFRMGGRCCGMSC